MKHIVNAVIVTCNRCELLKKSINALLEQTYLVNKIIIINNASTDGTKEYLDGLNNERILVIHKEQNEGGAGGFFYGMKEAYELGCDFVWIMDDDTISSPTALEELMLSYEKIQHRNIGFLASNVVYKDETPCFMNICTPDYLWNEYVSEGIVRITHCSFVAMLIPAWVIKRVGYPIKEYFIWGDDGEYSTRILQQYEGYLCGKSKVYHYMNANVGVDIWNIEKDRINRFFYFYRNWMCTNKMRNKESARKFERETRNLIKQIRKSNTNFKSDKIRIIKKGLRAGKYFNVNIVYPDKNESSHEITFKEKGGLTRIVKKILIKYDVKTQGYVTQCKNLFRKYVKVENSKYRQFTFLVKGFFSTRLYNSGKKEEDLKQLLSESKIQFCESKYFAYTVDVYKTWKISNRQMANCTVDYDILIDSSLRDLLMGGNNEYENVNNNIIDTLHIYNQRLKKCVKQSKLENKSNIIKYIERLEEYQAESLAEALQRILYVNQIMWQTSHIQMGLGRLDLMLEKYLSDDISDEYLDDIFLDFINVLHSYYWLKSEEMPGDTGQIIILGGVDKNGNYVCNRITYSIIRAIMRAKIPDPKILLRVSTDTPKELWSLAIKCMATGLGSPLLSNDDRVISELVQFGYDIVDARNYVTSACWELIPGNCCEQNNIGVFDWAIPLDLVGKKENLEELDTFDKFVMKYSEHLSGHVYFMSHLTDNIVWEKDPLLSFFKNSCRTNQKDISEGGGKYNNYGILSVGFGNAINSLINIRRFVYKEHRYTLREMYTMRNKNFLGHEETYELLKNAPKYFGKDDESEDVVGLANWLISRVNDVLKYIDNPFGGKIKFGLSSPGYIIMGKNSEATFDGRLDGEPYSIHISSDDNQDITALLNFASKLNYGEHAFNGNVVDFTMSPTFIKDNMSKFIALLQGAVKTGVFQMQMNVLDSKTLIEAKKDPTKFPNLIVRVWGFSAYFKDLPEEYQNYVIERALKNEAVN